MEKKLPVLLYVLFALLALNIACHVNLIYDSAHQAIVSKNLANGYGWAESYHGKVLLWCLTSGPTLLFPGALIIAILGNKIWVPGFAVCVLNLLLLGIFFIQMRQVIAEQKKYLAFCLGVCFLFLYYDNFWWGYYLGELSSFLLLLIACTVIANIDINKHKKQFFLVGLLAGLAFNAKLIVLPGFAGLGFILLCLAIFSRQSSFRLQALALYGALGLLAILVPVSVFEALNLAHDGRYSFIEYLRFRQDFISAKSSPGFNALVHSEEPFAILLANITYEYHKLLGLFHAYGISQIALVVLLVILLVLFVAGLKTCNDRQKCFVWCLAGALLFYAIWFFVAAHIIFDRHALHVVLIFFILLLFLVARQFSLMGIVALIVLLLIAAPSDKRNYFFNSVTFRDPSHGQFTEYNKAILDMADYIEQHSFAAPLANCGWMNATREIEFLLPASDNFKDCDRLIEDALVQKSDGSYEWKYAVNFTLLVNNIYWPMAKSQGNNRKTQPLIMRACKNNLLYENPLYRLMECRFEDIQRYVPLDADTPFVNAPLWWKKEVSEAQ